MLKALPSSKLFFFLALFFLPFQFGPHFWPVFSFVHGIRIDYLSPALYLSDLFLVLLFLASAKNVFKNPDVKRFLLHPVFLLFIFLCFVPVFSAPQPLALLWSALKLCEFLYFGLYVATQLKKSDIETVFEIFVTLGVFEALLATAEFLKQHSLNGVFYFLGERNITPSSLGAAVMDSSKGLLLRPYGTFPHPNILAFFLFVSVVFAAYAMHHAKQKKRAIFLAAIILIEAGLFLTFARAIILLNMFFLLYSFGFVTFYETQAKIKKILFVLAFFLFILSYFALFTNRFLFPSIYHDVMPRLDLIQISIQIIKRFPVFGTGLNNYFYYQETLQTNLSSIYLQPVHNIFLLLLSQVGISGFITFLYFLTLATQSAWRKARLEKKIFSYTEIPFVLIVSIIFTGFFDHFFFTIQQGELLFAFILALTWSKSFSNSTSH